MAETNSFEEFDDPEVPVLDPEPDTGDDHEDDDPDDVMDDSDVDYSQRPALLQKTDNR